MKISEIREKYPSYSDLSDGELAFRLWNKSYKQDTPMGVFADEVELSNDGFREMVSFSEAQGYEPSAVGRADTPQEDNTVGGAASQVLRGASFGFGDGSGEEQRFDVDGVGGFGSGATLDVWSSIVEYEDGALVEGSDGNYYRSLQNNNIGNDPTSSPAFWEQVDFLRLWNSTITYPLGQLIVGSDGKLYNSIQANNLNNDPTTSPLWWELNNPFDQGLNTTDDVIFKSINATVIGDVTPDEGTFTTLNMTDIGSDWTNAGNTIGDLGAVTTADINGGTIDDTAIGQTAAAAASFTDLDSSNTADFSAAGIYLGAASASNLLDDYEEGTWTPAQSGVTLTVTSANYTKIGRKVILDFDITIPSNTDATLINITGLPFTPVGNTGGSVAGFTNASVLIPISNNAAGLQMYNRAGSPGTRQRNQDLSTNRIVASYVYTTTL